MPSQKNTNRFERRFARALVTAQRIYQPARIWMKYTYESFDENPYQPRVAQKVVGLAFLSCVSYWEQYLEDIFLAYMCGAKDVEGNGPQLLLGPCRSRSHALQILGAANGPGDPSRSLRWSDFKWVKHVASLFFKDGKPFTDVENEVVARLFDANDIRNRVAHDSAKARLQFKRVANRLRGFDVSTPLPRGFSPGELLATVAPPDSFGKLQWLASDDHHWDDIFENFIMMYFNLAEFLTPIHPIA